jgi:hypothetical protein
MSIVLGILLLLGIFGLYFAPTIAAINNRETTTTTLSIFCVNAAFGWTIIGWLFAAAMVVIHARKRGFAI